MRSNPAIAVCSVVRHFITYAMIGVLGAWIAASTGCMSDRVGNQLAEAILSKTLIPQVGFGASVTGFRVAKKRWPIDRDELSAFIEQSDGKFQPVPYDHVDFTEKPDGSLDIYATSPSMTNRMTLKVNESDTK